MDRSLTLGTVDIHFFYRSEAKLRVFYALASGQFSGTGRRKIG